MIQVEGAAGADQAPPPEAIPDRHLHVRFDRAAIDLVGQPERRLESALACPLAAVVGLRRRIAEDIGRIGDSGGQLFQDGGRRRVGREGNRDLAMAARRVTEVPHDRFGDLAIGHDDALQPFVLQRRGFPVHRDHLSGMSVDGDPLPDANALLDRHRDPEKEIAQDTVEKEHDDQSDHDRNDGDVIGANIEAYAHERQQCRKPESD